MFTGHTHVRNLPETFVNPSQRILVSLKNNKFETYQRPIADRTMITGHAHVRNLPELFVVQRTLTPC
jgi:hypothetical protein